jgi:hypothetical protein
MANSANDSEWNKRQPFNMARSIGYHSCNLLLSKHEKAATG